MGRATEALVYVTSGRKLPPDVLSRFAYLSDAELAKLDRIRRRIQEERSASVRTEGKDDGRTP